MPALRPPSSLTRLLAGLAFVAVLALSAVRPVSAQFAVFDPALFAQNTTTIVKALVNDVLVEGAVPAILSGVNYFVSQLAYQAAVALTSECPGQTVCWDSKSFQQGFKDAVQGAAGEAIGTLSDQTGLTALGFDLCAPPNIPEFGPQFTLNLQLGLLDEYKPPPPKCDFNQITENWDAVKSSLSTNETLQQVSSAFKSGQTPLSTSLQIRNAVKVNVEGEAARTTRDQQQADAAAGGGFSAIVDPVSGRVKAPAATVLEEFKNLKYLQNQAPQDAANAAISGQIASKSVLSVVPTALSVFGQTLLTRLWNKFADGLLSTEALILAQPDIILNPEGSVQSPGAIGASIARSLFLAPPPRDIGQIDPLLEFTTCPVTPATPRGLNNCILDGQFASAVRVAEATPLTVRQAMERGLLHGEWPLISSNNRTEDQDPFCYTSGYCESNLKKLRAARIIPIGWEIAAAQSPVQAPDKLKDVVDGFHDCNAQGQLDSEHRFCHLIDPDWVLKVPPAQCRAQAFGPQLVSSSIANRGETCVDQPTCIRQDDAGNCVGGFGYCTQEKRVWRFNADSCPAEFNTCRTVTAVGTQAPRNFLLNTITAGSCNADNAGCAEYALQRNPADSLSVASDDWLSSGQSRFLTRQAESCNPGEDGCTALFQLSPTQSLNLVRNGSFERAEDADGDGAPDRPEHWTAPFGIVPAGRQGSLAIGAGAKSGANAVRLDAAGGAPTSCALSGGAACNKEAGCPCKSGGYSCKMAFGQNSCAIAGRLMQDGIALKQNVGYTLSASFLPIDERTAIAGVATLTLRNAAGLKVSLLPAQASLIAAVDGGSGACRVNSVGVIELTANRGDGARGIDASCNFLISVPVVQATLELSGSTALVDDVQIEEGGLTPFHDGYGAAPATVHAKVAPAGLSCSGSAGDPAQCGQYSQVCRAAEVGCERYTPTNGDPSVPAITSVQDRCPNECVGFDTFKQQATVFDAERFPVYFIPATARSCSQAEVGCTEFTNVRTEERAYFSSLRMCQRPDAEDSVTFYSWEGSDTTGFQLRVWTFKESNLVSANTTIGPDIAPASTASTAGKGPCTQLNAQSGACEDKPEDLTGVCTRDSLEAGNFDCREFYDADGNRHYRLLSQVVLATPDCETYRITVSDERSCADSNGRWDGVKNECTYDASSGESVSCSSQSNGCRAYTGDTAGNARQLFHDEFEQGISGWTGTVQQSSEAVTVGGHSLKMAGVSRRAERSVADAAAPGRTYILTFWARGSGAIQVAFDSGTNTTAYPFADERADTAVPTVLLASQWRQYSVGPVTVTDPQWGKDGRAFLAFQPTGSADAYIDNVLLKEVQDSFFVIRDSWNTPAACNRTSSGQFAPLAMLGCKAYTTSTGAAATLKSFSALCREQAVGCTAYSASQNTIQTPYAQTFNAVCTTSQVCAGGAACPCNFAVRNPAGTAPLVLADVCRVAIGQSECRFNLDGAYMPASGAAPAADTVVIPADERQYLVVRPQDRCDASSMSCRAMGQAHYTYEQKCENKNAVGAVVACNADGGCECAVSATERCTVLRGQTSCQAALSNGVIDRWDVVAKKDDPSLYARSLCTASGVGCEAWSAGDGQFFFKDPANKTCEYKENVTVEGQVRSGWFRQSETGSLLPCYPDILRDGDFFDIAKNGDSVYDGWVGACKPEFDRCEELVDPADISQNAPRGTPYYYLMNSKLDTKSCAGNVGLRDGCVLFDRTSVREKTFSSAATYLSSERQSGGASVQPESCDGGSRSGACEKRCTAVRNGLCSITNDLCSQDSDCAPVNGTAQSCVGDRYYGDGCFQDSECNVGQGERCVAEASSSARTFTADDANIVVKVRPDRECGQWFACNAEQTVFDTQQNKYRTVCTGFDLCEENRRAGQAFECVQWVDPAKTLLTKEAYSARDTTWRGRDFSGYSVVDRYAASLVKPVNVGSGATADVRFGVILDATFTCTENGATNDCPTDERGPASCVKGLCVYDMAGGPLRTDALENTALCRAYPEADAPFPRSVLKSSQDPNAKERLQAFAGANVCGENGEGCECSYVRSTFGPGNIFRFSSASGASAPSGVCLGGPSDGQACNPADAADDTCKKAQGGQCLARTATSNVTGWQGLCLDFNEAIPVNGDPNRFACNLWLPVDQLSGAPDVFNQNVAAGFVTDSSHLLYCAAAHGAAKGSGAGPTYDVVVQEEAGTFADASLFKVQGQDANVRTISLSSYGIKQQDIAGIKIDFTSSAMQSSAGPKHFYLFRDGAATATSWQNGFYWREGSPGGSYDGPEVGNLHTGDQSSGPNGGIIGEVIADATCVSLIDDADRELTCERLGGGGDNTSGSGPPHCLAARANFDAQGNLQSLQTVLCADTSGLKNVALPVKVTVQLREQCRDLALVHSTSNASTTGSIWPGAPLTNALHQAISAGQLSADYPLTQQTTRFNFPSTPSGTAKVDLTPFGPAGTRDNVFRNPAGEPAYPVWESEGGAKNYAVRVNAAGNDYELSVGDTVAGNPFSCIGPCKKTAANNKGASFGVTELQKLFAVTLGRFAEGASGNYGQSAGNWDLRRSLTPISKAPKALAVDTADCAAVGQCPELSEGLTVNGSVSGLVQGVGGRFKAVIQYYAFADKDHMPIRRKAVDFLGDRSQVVATEGYYKNHRGIARDSSGKATSLCQSSPAEFGKTPESCEQYFFEETRTYVCTEELLAKLPACAGNYPCARDGACVYKPAVHIMDNWGACTGSCNGDACINSVLGVDDQCDYRTASPWTRFAGEILVRP